MKRILDLKKDLTVLLKGTSLNKLFDVNTIIELAARDVLNDLEILELRRSSELPFVFTELPTFIPPKDLLKNKIVSLDINNFKDARLKVSNSNFDGIDTIYRNGVKLIHVDGVDIPMSFTLFDFDNVDDVSGTGTLNYSNDTQDYFQGDSSLVFDTDGTNPFDITISNMNVDVSPYENKGEIYTFVYIPDQAIIDNIKLTLYSSATDYIEQTITTDVFGLKFSFGWNVIKFDFKKVTETGTLDYSAVNKIQFKYFDSSAIALKGFKLDSSVSINEDKSKIDYYSSYMFSNNDKGRSDRVYTDDDVILVDEAYNLLLYKTAETAFRHSSLSRAKDDTNEFIGKYITEKRMYQGDLPTASKKTALSYYKFPKHRR